MSKTVLISIECLCCEFREKKELDASKCIFFLPWIRDLLHPRRLAIEIELRRKFLNTLHFIDKINKRKKELTFHSLGDSHLN